MQIFRILRIIYEPVSLLEKNQSEQRLWYLTSLHTLNPIQAIFCIQEYVLDQIVRYSVILKILLMRFHRRFTELKNLDSWLRYETSKLAPTHTFSNKRMENRDQKSPFSYVKIHLSFLLISCGIPFLAQLLNFVSYTNSM